MLCFCHHILPIIYVQIPFGLNNLHIVKQNWSQLMRFGEVSDHIDVMYQIQSLLLHILGTILNIPFLATNPLLLYSLPFPSFPTLFPNNITTTTSSFFSSLFPLFSSFHSSLFQSFLPLYLLCLLLSVKHSLYSSLSVFQFNSISLVRWE